MRHAQDPAGGAHNFPPDSLAGHKGAYFYRRGREGEEGIRREYKGKEREEKDTKRGDEKGEQRRGEDWEGVCLTTFNAIPPPL